MPLQVWIRCNTAKEICRGTDWWLPTILLWKVGNSVTLRPEKGPDRRNLCYRLSKAADCGCFLLACHAPESHPEDRCTASFSPSSIFFLPQIILLWVFVNPGSNTFRRANLECKYSGWNTVMRDTNNSPRRLHHNWRHFATHQPAHTGSLLLHQSCVYAII